MQIRIIANAKLEINIFSDKLKHKDMANFISVATKGNDVHYINVDQIVSYFYDILTETTKIELSNGRTFETNGKFNPDEK